MAVGCTAAGNYAPGRIQTNPRFLAKEKLFVERETTLWWTATERIRNESLHRSLPTEAAGNCKQRHSKPRKIRWPRAGATSYKSTADPHRVLRSDGHTPVCGRIMHCYRYK